MESCQSQDSMHQKWMFDGLLRYVVPPEMYEILSYTYDVTHCCCIVKHQFPEQIVNTTHVRSAIPKEQQASHIQIMSPLFRASRYRRIWRIAMRLWRKKAAHLFPSETSATRNDFIAFHAPLLAL